MINQLPVLNDLKIPSIRGLGPEGLNTPQLRFLAITKCLIGEETVWNNPVLESVDIKFFGKYSSENLPLICLKSNPRLRDVSLSNYDENEKDVIFSDTGHPGEKKGDVVFNGHNCSIDRVSVTDSHLREHTKLFSEIGPFLSSLRLGNLNSSVIVGKFSLLQSLELDPGIDSILNATFPRVTRLLVHLNYLESFDPFLALRGTISGTVKILMCYVINAGMKNFAHRSEVLRTARSLERLALKGVQLNPYLEEELERKLEFCDIGYDGQDLDNFDETLLKLDENQVFWRTQQIIRAVDQARSYCQTQD